MVKTLYVGNLPYAASEEQLRELFAQHGTVYSVKLIADRELGSPRGFGFIEMEPVAASAAISALNGADFGGRTLRVDEAKDRGGSARRARD
jgi:RNA recognition motif-containing protein